MCKQEKEETEFKETKNGLTKCCKQCLEKASRSSKCPHGRQRSTCKDCGGTGICEHGKRRSICVDCSGASVCEHGRQRYRCKDCDPAGHLHHVVSGRIYQALKRNKTDSSLEYLSCTIDELRAHIELQFSTRGDVAMTWENYGTEWHIDHVKPIRFKEGGEVPTLEQVKERLHWTNTQPLWARDNLAKGNRFVG